ncbi:hypothetical protein [Paracidovorax valerianellae]|uniref:hypothetical protein n=1 Tax=Paracidovorax valerianellae TaxID=187868 RepID=UPI00111447A6|nr:hypothetical protein [Paracidovorax valerianellae]MDA8445328.1 hypothetical protein [Paracidovorax valerianellae]
MTADTTVFAIVCTLELNVHRAGDKVLPPGSALEAGPVTFIALHAFEERFRFVGRCLNHSGKANVAKFMVAHKLNFQSLHLRRLDSWKPRDHNVTTGGQSRRKNAGNLCFLTGFLDQIDLTI